MHHTSPPYPKDSAGRLLSALVPTVGVDTTVAEAEQLLQRDVADFSTINYIYVLTSERLLKGAVSLRELLRAPKDKTVLEIATTELVVARPYTDRERVAHLAIAHNLKAIPILHAHDHKFLGVVPSDAILETLQQEHTEDLMRFAGISKQHDFEAHLLEGSTLTHVASRLPWLFLGLLGGVSAAFVVEYFETTLAEELVLAAFIPAIVYMADAVGSQTQTLFVRALTISTNLPLGRYVAREFLVNFLLAGILASLIFVFATLWLQAPLLACVLGLSIFLTICFTVLVAIFLPWFFFKKGFDPAVASGPLATVIRDIVSLAIYLLVASALL